LLTWRHRRELGKGAVTTDQTTAPSGFLPLTALGVPIFRRNRGGHAVFYAPGFLAVSEASLADAFESRLGAGKASQDPVAAALRDHAERADASRSAAPTAPFEPVCLTLYLGNQCNLRCSYCYAEPSRATALRLDWPTIRPAGERVLTNCERRNVPLTLAVHGGGEPTLFPGLIDRVLDELEQAAASRGVPLVRYVATNGVLSAVRARWLARRFDIVGLSCDGPEPYQTAQRPTWAGGPSTRFVERTAKAVKAAGKPLHVRVTITSATRHHQPEIARYLCEQLRPDEIHLEPLYLGGRAGSSASLRPEHAPAFLDGFLEARRVAAGYGVSLLTSGSRVAELHGPYCNVFRDVLQLVPGGVATACFKVADAAAADARTMTIGRQEDGSGLQLDLQRIAALRQGLSRWPERCRSCFNRFHCTLGCPDSCPVDERAGPSEFRCQVQMALALSALDEIAEPAWEQARREHRAVGAEVSAP
jgi:sulfatase maturation enzyme AslB (radical SAM superfamily)